MAKRQKPLHLPVSIKFCEMKKNQKEKTKEDHLEETVLPDQPDNPQALVPSETHLVRMDPFLRYLAEIKKHPLLTSEEEFNLAVKYQKEKDITTAYRLVTSNLRLVVKIALEYQKAFWNIMDLIQEGNIGLMLAVKKFDPYKGIKLSTYASWWIKAYILKYIIDNFRIVKFGTTNTRRKLFFNLLQEKARLQAMGFTPGAKMLAEVLEASEEDIIDVGQRLLATDLSLDAPVREDSSESFGDFLAREEKFEDKLIEKDLREVARAKIRQFAKQIKPAERLILEKRIIAEEPRTLQELGAELGVTRERVRQIESRIVKKLTDFLKKEMPDMVSE